MAQSRIVADALRSCDPELQVELVPIVTRGDRAAGDLRKIGGKGLFTAELQHAVREGTIDIAVHSAKDLPTAMAGDLVIAAVPERADPRDALVSRAGWGISELPAGATVATASNRRAAQLLAARGDLDVVPIRGNVGTRLRKALAGVSGAAGRVDAVVLAMAGLLRSGLAEKHAESIRPLEVADFVPAAGQGALAVQAAAENGQVAELVASVDDPDSHQALLAERRVLTALGADCRSCVGIHIAPERGRWHGYAVFARPDGSEMIRTKVAARDAESVADELIGRLRT
jgi:hydroxymethylbilane synthase